jgi:hypothetical protein
MKTHGCSMGPLSFLLFAGIALAGHGPVASATEADGALEADPQVAPTSTTAELAATTGASPNGLEASSAVPWNPPGPVSRRRGWERAILLPGHIATLPLSGLGYLTDQALLYVEGTGLMARASFAARALPERTGISLAPARLGSRTGLGATVGLRTIFLGGILRNRLRADFSFTSRQYNQTLVTVQGRPARLEYGYEWRPRERFHGVGLETTEERVSAYASQSEFVRGSMRIAWNRDTEQSRPRTEVNLWAGPRMTVTRTGREPGTASFEVRFPELASPTLDDRIEHLIYGGSFSTDWRVGSQRWAGGWRTKVQGERYDRPNALTALRIGGARGAQFTRLEYETETGFSFMRDPRTVRFLVRVVDQSVTSDREHFLISDMATLGGRKGLAGFEAGRFHDMDLLVSRVSYIFPIVRRLEIDLHSEWGGVYSNVWGDPRLSTLRNSYGVALRGRLKEAPFGSLGLDFSREGARVRFSLGGVE